MRGVSFTLLSGSTFTSFLAHRSLRPLRHGCDPLDAPDGLGLQLRITAYASPSVVVRK